MSLRFWEELVLDDARPNRQRRDKMRPVKAAFILTSLLLHGCGETTSLEARRPVTVLLNDGAAETTDRDIQIRVSATGATDLRLAEGLLDTVAFRPFREVIRWRLAVGDGPRVIFAQVRYSDGKLSDVATDTIVLSEHVYASLSGEDNAAGTYLSPKRSVGAAIATATEENRNRVRLFAGRYAPSTTQDVFPIALAQGMTMESVDPSQPSVLDAEGTGGVVRLDAVDGVVLRALKLTGGVARNGGGLYLRQSSALAVALFVTANVASSRGSGIYIEGGELVLKQSVVAFNGSSLSADAHGVEIVDGSVQIFNNVIAFHDSNGLITRGSSIGDIRNNIFYSNGRVIPTRRGRGICEVSDPHRVMLRYNLFFANEVASVLFGSTDLTAEEANNLSLTDGIRGNLDADPAFVDAAAGDFSLLPGSPAIDAGDPNPVFNDRDGTRNDIGHLGGH